MNKEEIEELLRKAEFWMQFGMHNDAIKHYEQAAKESIILKELDLEFEARQGVMRCTYDNGNPEQQVASFPPLLALIDAHPGRFDESSVYWFYKWVIGGVTAFDYFSKERILALVEDMKTRYLENGFGEKVVNYFLQGIYADFGDFENAEKYRQKWMNDSDISTMEDCKACQLNTNVGYLTSFEKYTEAIEEASSILDGTHTCGQVPKGTYPNVLLSKLFLGKIDECQELYEKGIETVDHSQAELKEYAAYLIYLSCTKDFVKAQDIIENHFKYVWEYKSKKWIIAFYGAILIFLKGLQKEGNEYLKCDGLKPIPLKSTEEGYQIIELISFFEKEQFHLIKLFNERNGNDFYTKKYVTNYQKLFDKYIAL